MNAMSLSRPFVAGVILAMMFFAAALSRGAFGQNSSSVEGPAAPSAPTATWTAAAPCPATLSRYAFAQDGENFYVISDNSANGHALRRYNATTNVWTSLS